MKKPKNQKESREKGNLYDRIFKENAEAIFIPLIELELDIKIKSFKALPDKMTKTIEREMDFFYQVVTTEDEKFLLHIEFQTSSDEEMVYRIGEYHGLATRKYKMPIRHVVIYLGRGKSKMRTRLRPDEQYEGFELINLHRLNTDELLSSQVPEVILLSILSNFKEDRVESVLRLMLLQLKRACKSETEFLKFVKQLTILSRLRNFEVLADKIIDDMQLNYDVEKDGLYLKGVTKGRVEGKVEGRIEGKVEMVLSALSRGKSYEDIADFTELSIARIKEIDKSRKN